MPNPVVLENSQVCAVVLPQRGAGLARFDMRSHGHRLPVFRPLLAEPQDERDLALFLLAPFSNRIGAGGFAWNGRHYPLPANRADEPCPLHGDAWQQVWTVTEQSRSQARLQLRSRGMPAFAYDAEVEWRLEGATLCAALTLTHRGNGSMPYGGGFHPWFLRDPDVQLQAPADGWWAEDALHLPTHWNALTGHGPGDESRDFRQPRTLPAQFVNALYTGWDGRARMLWPRRGVALDVVADAPLNRYMFYSPGAEADFFCFEPVSHDINAHNAASVSSTGLVVLDEGECLRLSARFTAMAL